MIGEARRFVIRLNTVESFALFWLPKRISKIILSDDRADLDIRTDVSLVDPRFGEADVVIRFGARGTEPLVGRLAGLFSYGLFQAPGAIQTIRYVGRIADTRMGRWADASLDSVGPTIYCDSLSAAVGILASAGGRAALPAFVARERDWSSFSSERRLETDIMVLRKRVEKSTDVRTKIYNRLVRELRAHDFR
jgi:DNA-binding transcriptional LysR family regulator